MGLLPAPSSMYVRGGATLPAGLVEKERQAGRECVAPQAEENLSEKVNQIPGSLFDLRNAPKVFF